MDILGGRYKPSDTLPNESDLATELGVGRSSVREAMRVLTDKGMIEVRTRTGARVTDQKSWRRLDPDVVRWLLDAGPDKAFLEHLIEARRIFEPTAASLAAERATSADLAAIEKALEDMGKALPICLEDCVEADLAFHRAVLAAAGNPVLEEFEIVIDAALRAAFTLSTTMSQSYGQAMESHAEVLDAIRMRQPARARSAMAALLDVAASDLHLL
jgi:DNA-binding FadR family transcriptional regulator